MIESSLCLSNFFVTLYKFIGLMNKLAKIIIIKLLS